MKDNFITGWFSAMATAVVIAFVCGLVYEGNCTHETNEKVIPEMSINVDNLGKIDTNYIYNFKVNWKGETK